MTGFPRDVLKSEEVRPLGGCVEVFLKYPYTNNDHETTGLPLHAKNPCHFHGKIRGVF